MSVRKTVRAEWLGFSSLLFEIFRVWEWTVIFHWARKPSRSAMWVMRSNSSFHKDIFYLFSFWFGLHGRSRLDLRSQRQQQQALASPVSQHATYCAGMTCAPFKGTLWAWGRPAVQVYYKCNSFKLNIQFFHNQFYIPYFKYHFTLNKLLSLLQICLLLPYLL